MGFRISWLAVRGKDPASVREDLNLESTGEYEDEPESPVVGCQLSSAWYLVWANDPSFVASLSLKRVSTDCEVVVCDVNETTMACGSSEWKNSRVIWTIEHDCQYGIEHLQVKGNPPDQFASIRTRLIAKQTNDAEVDHVFSIPIEIAKSLTGFRYDEYPIDAKAKYEVLVDRKEEGRTSKWWQVWK